MAAFPDKHFRARILERRDLLRISGSFESTPADRSSSALDSTPPGRRAGGERIERAYSIVSSPYEDSLEFFIELVPHGDLTPGLFRLNKDDALLCRKLRKGASR